MFNILHNVDIMLQKCEVYSEYFHTVVEDFGWFWEKLVSWTILHNNDRAVITPSIFYFPGRFIGGITSWKVLILVCFIIDTAFLKLVKPKKDKM